MHGLSILKKKSLSQRRNLLNRRKILQKIDVHRIECVKGVSSNWIRRIVKTVIQSEGYTGEGDISVVLVDDCTIQDLNRRFLLRNRPTDVMVFPFGEEEEGFMGEIYVSIERAREQASMYGVSFEEELARLVVHGVLHLIGLKDSTPILKRKMTEIENYYLKQVFQQYLENNNQSYGQ